MKKNNFIIMSILILIISCSEKKNDFPIEKRYWDIEDYENIVGELKYNTKYDEFLPTFDDSETRPIIEKLTDEENFRIVLKDTELGTKHKNEIAQKFFDIWRDLNEIYSSIDKKDMFVYETEYLEIWNFGLELQQEYFKLGNLQITENSDESENISTILNSNIDTMINNSIIYLDEITNEKKFSSNGKIIISKTIEATYTKLINENPKANFSNLRKKIESLSKKIKDTSINKSLNEILSLIDEMKQKNETNKEVILEN